MTDPTNANKLLSVLAERAAKRRGQYKREEFKKVEKLEENQSQQLKEEESELQETEQEKSNFRPKKNIQQPVKEEFPLSDIEYFDDKEEPEEYSEPEVVSKFTRRFNNSSSNYGGNVPIRKARRANNRFNNSRNFNPENADSFEEQVELVGSLLCDKLSAFQSIPALRVTQEWIDCIVDENDSFYEEIYSKLILLNKEQLLGYIRILVSALK